MIPAKIADAKIGNTTAILSTMPLTYLVLMIGVNNLTHGFTGEETAEGSKAILDWIKANRPETKVLLLGCFPAGKTADLPIRKKVNSLHKIIQPWADGKTVFYQDLRPLFLDQEGKQNNRMRADTIHITGQGEDAWMKAVVPFLQK